MRGAPIVRLNHLGGLAGLGQPNAFTEQALQSKTAQLVAVRAEADAVEAEIQAIRTGRPVASRVQITTGSPPETGLPGGSVDIPVIGRVPVLGLVGAGALLLFLRKR